jgi:hypothetical protein
MTVIFECGGGGVIVLIFKKCHIQPAGPHKSTIETMQHAAIKAKLRKTLNEENITLQ